MSRSIDDCFNLLANFIQAAGYEYDDQLYVTRVSKPMAVVADKPKTKRFIKPIQPEVQAYMESKGVIDQVAYDESNKFINHFTSNGWKIGGKAAMKCWKSAVSTWLTRKAEDIQKETKRYSFQQLAQGKHLETIPNAPSQPQVIDYAAQFDALRIESNA